MNAGWKTRSMVDESGSEDRDPVVLGREMALAHDAERAHQAANPTVESPLADLTYDRWAGELDLARFTPSTTDEAIRERLEGWQLHVAADLRARLTMDDFFTLLAFARRAVVRSLRGDDLGWAEAGAHALPLVSADRVDWRDLAWAAAMIAWELQRTGQRAYAVLMAAAGTAEPEAAAILRRFAADPPDNLRDEWGLELVQTPKGLGLAQADYFAAYEPSADLLAGAISLAEALDVDRYLADNLTVAADLPDVWLRGPGHEEGSAALERMRGCVSIGGDPRPETGAPPMTQMLTAWIVEMANDHDARTVTEAATRATGDHVRLAQHLGSLCCVLIARSVQVGMPALETDETIERLAPAIAAALAAAH